jgi:UDP-N-acetylmuramate dehydrogenase
MAVFRKNEPMSAHTTFRVGGPADLYAEPESLDDLQELIAVSRGEGKAYTVIGNGSNLLVGDKGYRGIVIALGKKVAGIRVNGTRLTAEAGALLSVAAGIAQKEGLSGMECLSGIPGSVGGALVMNAGAYGGEIRDILVSANVLEADGTVSEVPAAELELGYRSSNIPSLGRTVLSAEFSLTAGNPEEIAAKMKELNGRRKEKQPLEYPSAGSTFKRPEGYFAGKLIEDAGLRGFTVGGAMVSEKHCGFVINRGNATAGDILALIREVRRRVLENSGVLLEPEVKMMGEFA